MIFGFENMLRLNEEGLIDEVIFENVIDSSLFYLTSPRIQTLLAERRGVLSGRLAEHTLQRASALGMGVES